MDATWSTAFRKAQIAFDRISLPDEPTVEDAVRSVEAVCGRTVVLATAPRSADWGPITGLLARGEKDVIFTCGADARVYRDHNLFHELGHILGNHHGCQMSVLPRSADIYRLRPRLDDVLLPPVEQEVVAERIAYLLAASISVRTPVYEVAW